MKGFILRILKRLKLVRPDGPAQQTKPAVSRNPTSNPLPHTKIHQSVQANAPRAAPQKDNPLLDAAQSIYDTADEEHEQLIISPPSRSGQMTNRRERWDITDKGRINTQQRHKVVAASGAVVNPENLKSVCSCCHHFSDDLIRSTTSGLPLCARCRRILETPHGTEVLTELEYQKAIQSFDTWAAARQLGPNWKAKLNSSDPGRFIGRT